MQAHTQLYTCKHTHTQTHTQKYTHASTHMYAQELHALAQAAIASIEDR